MSLIAELKRRKVFKVGAAYLVVAWLAVQAMSIGFPAFDAPPWALRIFILIALLGFPVAVVVAWVFDVTPEGVKFDADASGSKRLFAVAGLLIVLALGWYFYGQPSFRRGDVATPTATAPQKSIAVLAFLDLSEKHDQEYFSDGMSEEILNALAQVKDLKVAGRTSSFFYKGRNEDLRTIGKALGVANILEGSVRKQGDKVRITAQLIRVSDDTHLWSHDYDGDLSDVFKLQENIARAITDQLKVVLTGEQKARLVQVGTSNTEAYNLYLKAAAPYNQRDYKGMGEAIGWLEQAIQLDPNFAAAHARLAMIHVLGWAKYGASKDEAARQAQLALALDPKLAETQYALSFLARQQRRFMDARKAMDRALELAPNDAATNFYDAQLLINTGYTRQGIARLDRALAIDPLLPNALHWRAEQYLFAGDTDTAERLWKRAGEVGLSYADVGFAQIARARGDYAKARSLDLPRMLANPDYIDCLKAPKASVAIYLEGAFRGDAAAGAKAQAVIDECLAAKPDKVPLWAVLGLLHFGQNERALQVILQGPSSDDAGLFIYLWSPQDRDARRLPAFAQFARKVGFADLWDKVGAPDLCKKSPAGDYVCE
jgi:TolB-like protein